MSRVLIIKVQLIRNTCGTQLITTYIEPLELFYFLKHVLYSFRFLCNKIINASYGFSYVIRVSQYNNKFLIFVMKLKRCWMIIYMWLPQFNVVIYNI